METKTTAALDLAALRARDASPKQVKPTRYISAPCRDCGIRTSALLTTRNIARDAASGPVFHGHWGGICIACRRCGKELNATMVRGTFSKVHTCGAKCLASKGPTCECSCGGKNHGAGHEATAPEAGLNKIRFTFVRE